MNKLCCILTRALMCGKTLFIRHDRRIRRVSDNWISRIAGCSCVVYSSSDKPQGGTFTSPYYPKRYPSNIDCLLYTFIGQPDEIVKLTFHHFNIRRIRSDCVGGDFLKVFLHLETNGVSEYTPWTGVLCGDLHDIPQVLYSSRSTLILELHTQGPPSNATGFFGNFQFINRHG